MVNCRCRYCGQLTDRPMLFTLTCQRVFNYIWDHPECTAYEIAKEFYGRTQLSYLIEHHIYSIRKSLVGTDYKIINTTTGGRSVRAKYVIQQTP